MHNEKILFIAPRFHTNQYFLTKNLIQQNIKLLFLSIYIGGSENHDYVQPIISKPSKIFNLFVSPQNIESPKSRERLRKYHFTSFFQSLQIYNKHRPDILIIRNLKSLFSIQHLLFGLLYGKTIFLYTQNNYRAHLSPKRRLFYKCLGFFKIKHFTPVYGDPEAPETPNSIYLPFVIEKMVSTSEVIARKNRSGIKIITIGKFVERKNILELLKAMSRIEKFKSIENELIIVGECRTKDQKEYYKLLKKEIPQDSFRVTFELNKTHGQVLELLKKSDLYILPSINEPAAFSILEAMACGLGVICTHSNGTKCYIQNDVNGKVFHYSDDLGNLVNILNVILDREILTSYGLESLKLVEKNHNVEKFINNVINPS